jgi:hypothetical protein
MQPGAQRPAVIKPVQALPGSNESVLREILGLIRAPRQPQQVPVDARIVRAEKLMAGRGVADPELLDEPGIMGSPNLLAV